MCTDQSGCHPGQRASDAGSSTEERIAHIWQEILGSKNIGYNENFFELSGRSVDALRLINRIRSVFGVDITVRTVLESATIVNLAKVIETAPRSSFPKLQAGAVDTS
jgi:acyl carrier protein